jgi:CTP:molybdopterin cytidylyltransferase MocA
VIAALLLAAGESTRMGQLKALLPWRGTTLLEYALAELSGARVDVLLVVLGHAADELAPIVERAGARAVLNPRYREGRATSIAAGVAALPTGVGHLLVASVDQPRPRAVVDALLAAHLAADAPISRAVHGGKHGHPTVFAAALLGELRRADESSEGMKSVLRGHAEGIQDVEIDDPAVLLNLNTPEQYAAALNRP